MKKKLIALTALSLSAVAVFGATGCASKKVTKLLPEDGFNYSSKMKTLNFTQQTNSALNVSVDSTGLAVITENGTDYYGNSSTTYSLFNVRENKPVSNASITVANAVSTDATYTGIVKKTDGFYYSRITYTNDNTATYTLYDKTGSPFSGLTGAFNEENVFVASNGYRYYLNVEGKIKMEKDPLARIFTLSNKKSSGKVGEYFIKIDLYNMMDGITIYDASGNYQRPLDIDTICETTESVVEEYPMMWSVEKYIFFQYSNLLSEEAKKYDYVSYDEETGKLQKYDLVTKRYDVEKDRVKDIDMDYVVVNYDTYSYNDETVVLYVSEIVDEQLMKREMVQSFNKKGDVAVDLQELVPGAKTIKHVTGDSIVLCANDTDYVVQKKEVVAQFPSGRVSYNRNVAVLNNGTNINFYHLTGSQAKSYENVVDYTSAGFGYYLIQTVDKVIKYDTSSKKETEICTYNTAMTDIVSLDKDYGVYVNVNSNAYGTSVVKTYFADGNLQMLESNANVEYNYKILSQYGYQDGDTYVRGAVFYISEKNNYTDITQYTYYTYETTSPIF